MRTPNRFRRQHLPLSAFEREGTLFLYDPLFEMPNLMSKPTT